MSIVADKRPRRINFIMAPEFIPICPEHQCDMKSYDRGPIVVYFRCPMHGCRCTDKVARKLFVAVTQTSTSNGTDVR